MRINRMSVICLLVVLSACTPAGEEDDQDDTDTSELLGDTVVSHWGCFLSTDCDDGQNWDRVGSAHLVTFQGETGYLTCEHCLDDLQGGVCDMDACKWAVCHPGVRPIEVSENHLEDGDCVEADGLWVGDGATSGSRVRGAHLVGGRLPNGRIAGGVDTQDTLPDRTTGSAVRFVDGGYEELEFIPAQFCGGDRKSKRPPQSRAGRGLVRRGTPSVQEAHEGHGVHPRKRCFVRQRSLPRPLRGALLRGRRAAASWG